MEAAAAAAVLQYLKVVMVDGMGGKDSMIKELMCNNSVSL